MPLGLPTALSTMPATTGTPFIRITRGAVGEGSPRIRGTAVSQSTPFCIWPIDFEQHPLYAELSL